ncbi:MAG: O-antigen ligase family protein [Haemophilus parainfluenzae]|jgi:O-antigen polymerase (rfal protein)|uniref:WaaL n=1 Tax=Haemophilus parainfluenzae TaxID=729 RepID=R9WPK8_HAEPA|nr:WaaL [Haemophilus parainfluenzae]MBF1217769.1 O-antigen ligase family protein [Haemophilus parainfluenzae]
MLNIGNSPKLFINASIFLFFTLLLMFPKGYNYGSTALLVLSILFLCYLLYKRVSFLEVVKQNKAIFVVTTFYFLVSLFFIFFHEEKIKLIDNPLRAFLFLSVIVFIVYSSVKFDVLLYSIPLGSFISGVVALYQYYILSLESAFYNQMKIQSGDIAMSLGLFSFVIAFHLLDINKHKKKLVALVILFGIFGVLASLLSFARGGWVGIPILLLILIFLYRHLLSKKLLLLGGITFLCIISVVLTVNNKFVNRLSEAQYELKLYLSGDDKVSSIGERLDMWKIGSKAFLEHPISGWSLKELDYYKKDLSDKNIVTKASISFSHLHNQFIDESVKKGIVGGVAILGVFFLPLYVFYTKQKNKQNNKRIKFITTLGIVHILSTMSYCVTQAFISHNSGNIFYFFVLFLFYAFMVNESATTSE